jgi:uncharacterized membrane protein
MHKPFIAAIVAIAAIAGGGSLSAQQTLTQILQDLLRNDQALVLAAEDISSARAGIPALEGQNLALAISLATLEHQLETALTLSQDAGFTDAQAARMLIALRVLDLPGKLKALDLVLPPPPTVDSRVKDSIQGMTDAVQGLYLPVGSQL